MALVQEFAEQVVALVGSPLTFDLTGVTAGNDLLFGMALTGSGASARTITLASNLGGTIDLLVDNSPNQGARIYRLKNAAGGTHTITVTETGSLSVNVVIQVGEFSDLDQSATVQTGTNLDSASTSDHQMAVPGFDTTGPTCYFGVNTMSSNTVNLISPDWEQLGTPATTNRVIITRDSLGPDQDNECFWQQSGTNRVATSAVVAIPLASPAVTEPDYPYVASVTRSLGANSQTVSLPQPDGLTVGDLLVAQVAFRGLSYAISPPDGTWTSILNTTGGVSTQETFWKIADADDVAASTFDFTTAGASVSNIGLMWRWVNHDPSDPIGSVTGEAEASSTAWSIAGITPEQADSSLAIFGATTNDNSDLSAVSIATDNPATWYIEAHVHTGAGFNSSAFGAWANRPETSATGTVSATLTVSNSGVLQIIEVRKASSSNLSASVNDAVTVADTATVVVTPLRVQVNDTVTIAEHVVVSEPPIDVVESESVSVTDNVQVKLREVQIFDTSGTFTVPSGVTELTIYAWGGGGPGGAVDNGALSGGGAGGAFAKGTIDVTPGNNVTITVATATLSNLPTNPDGADSSVNGDNGTFVLAKGGAAAPNVDGAVFGAGGNGTTTGSTGNLALHAGGDGADAATGEAGGGGGGAGSHAAGGSTANFGGGAGGLGTFEGGSGGTGSRFAGSGGTSGSIAAPGGGGGGSYSDGTLDGGGTGAKGRVVVEWDAVAVDLDVAVNDAVTVVDVATARVSPILVTASDALTVADVAVAALTPLNVAASDSVTVVDDAHTAVDPISVAAAEAVSVTDSVASTTAGALVVSVFDVATVEDSNHAAVSPVVVRVDDTATVIDAASAVTDPLVLSVDDVVSVSDIAQVVLDPLVVRTHVDVTVLDALQAALDPLLLPVFEAVSVEDAAVASLGALVVSAHDSATVTDSAQVAVTPLVVRASDDVTVTEDARAVLPLVVRADDTLAVDDNAIAVVSPLVAQVNEAVAVTPAAQVATTPALVSVDDQITVTDVTTPSLDLLVNVHDAVTTTDAAQPVTHLGARLHVAVAVSDAVTAVVSPLTVRAGEQVSSEDHAAPVLMLGQRPADAVAVDDVATVVLDIGSQPFDVVTVEDAVALLLFDDTPGSVSLEQVTVTDVVSPLLLLARLSYDQLYVYSITAHTASPTITAHDAHPDVSATVASVEATGHPSNPSAEAYPTVTVDPHNVPSF